MNRVLPLLTLFTATLASNGAAAQGAPSAAPAGTSAKLLRYPHIQGDKITFVHGGDLWTASAQGGDARRVTSFDAGLEIFPRISPDGEWIAFSGEYTGSRQIWLVPYAGGEPRQLTFYPDVGPMPPRGGYDHLPLDWTPDGKKILIRANRTPYGQRVGRYFYVDPWNGGLETPLQIPEGGPASLSPDGSKLAYDIISREWRTWKRYRAGRAQDVWIYDLQGNAITQVTDFAGTDNFPMWLGDKIYFTSDRASGGTLNLFCYDLSSEETRQITQFDRFDVLWPSRGQGGLIFECGGELYVMDAVSEKVRKLEIRLADDRPWLRPGWKSGGFATYAPSPSGKRVLVEYRGEIFSAPKEKGEVRNLTRSPDRRERDPSWSPDGKTITYLAEVGDDYELFARDVATRAERQLTKDTGAWILDYEWTADSERIVFNDKRNRLRALVVATGAITEIDRGEESTINEWALSGDSLHITYTKTGENTYRSIWLSSLDAPEPVQVTTDHYRDGSPAFDPEGRYLYFLSARDYKHDGYEFDYRMYALLLRDDVEHPLAPESDEEPAPQPTDEDDEEKGEDAEEEEGEDEDVRWQIDFDGLADRIVALPGAPGNYRGLEGIDDGLLFYLDGELHRYDLDKRKSEQVLDGLSGYLLTPDRNQIFYRYRGDVCYAKPSPGQKAGANKLDLSGMRVRVVPNAEWRQMFGDAWRIMRDWFYDPKMHAVDWVAQREKYAPLVAHASHRSDLDFLLGELVGELNCGHTYVTTGELPRVERVPTGLLGCEFEQTDSGHYRIAKIFPGENWHERTRSPLTEPGVDVEVGDYLLAVDARDVRAPETPYHALENTVGRHVTLRVAKAADGTDAREVVVRPIASEVGLRYFDWVERNRAMVDKLSGGRIGYLHVPNTAIDGHRELFKGFRPQARTAEAMIIDDRYNGGGFIPDDMAFALAKPVLNYWARRDTQLDTTPTFAFEGPMTMLINGYSSSGGDAFPYYFRRLGLGKLIGSTTWGGLVGYSGSPRLLDGGGLAVPSFAFVNDGGAWDVEAVGVTPDIEVFDDPSQIQAGREPVLEAAVQHLLEELQKSAPPQRPLPPAGPDRRR